MDGYAQKTYENNCLEKGKNSYLQSEYSDVGFLFGEKDAIVARVPAHKANLAGSSDVFRAIFYGDLKEPGDVHIQDSNDAAFMEFLQYFYLSKVKLTKANVVSVLHLGEKYDIEKCVIDCIQFLMETLDNENVCDRFGLAILYDNKEMQKMGTISPAGTFLAGTLLNKCWSTFCK